MNNYRLFVRLLEKKQSNCTANPSVTIVVPIPTSTPNTLKLALRVEDFYGNVCYLEYELELPRKAPNIAVPLFVGSTFLLAIIGMGYVGLRLLRK